MRIFIDFHQEYPFCNFFILLSISETDGLVMIILMQFCDANRAEFIDEIIDTHPENSIILRFIVQLFS